MYHVKHCCASWLSVSLPAAMKNYIIGRCSSSSSLTSQKPKLLFLLLILVPCCTAQISSKLHKYEAHGVSNSRRLDCFITSLFRLTRTPPSWHFVRGIHCMVNSPHTGPMTMETFHHVDGLVQERRNSSASAMELRLFCTNPSMCFQNHSTK